MTESDREIYDLAREIYSGLIAHAVMLHEDICFDCIVLNAKRTAQEFVERYETIDDVACQG